MTDRYSKLGENVALRKQWSERIGTGLDLADATLVASALRGKDPSARIVVKRTVVRRNRQTGPPAPSVAQRPQPPKQIKTVESVQPAFTADIDDLDPYFYSTSEPVADEVV